MAFKEALQILTIFSFVTEIVGHGYMTDPAARNSAWRYGFKNPVQYTDNELNCGGFSVQWERNGGKCGVCGDAYHLKNMKYVYPGKYANGIITKTYRQGQQITVSVKITSNHRGSFKFRIGEIGKPPITQEKLTYLLKQPNGADSWPIPLASGNAVFTVQLVLPAGLSCDHCVMQWWWKTGNSWGCDDNGCGVGNGEKQETFVNCADVKILSNGGPGPTEPPTPHPTGPPVSTLPPVMTTVPPTPPPTQSPPGSECKGTGPWTGNESMDKWCHVNCARGYCPSSVCECS